MKTLDERDFSDNPLVPVYERVTEGPRKVGSMIREVVQTPLIRMEIFSEITRHSPNEHLEYEFWSDGMRGELAYQLEDAEDGTRLTQRVNIRFTGVSKILTPLLPLFYKPRVEKRLEAIKDILERKHQETGIT
jgi:hypothetical protein